MTAINPTCNKMHFQHQYGDEVCNSTCGEPYTPKPTRVPRTTRPTTPTPTTSHLENKTCEMVDTVFEGHDVQVIDDVETWEECATHCFQMKDVCTHFSWKDKTCSLKDSDEGKQEEQGTISGTAECGEGL